MLSGVDLIQVLVNLNQGALEEKEDLLVSIPPVLGQVKDLIELSPVDVTSHALFRIWDVEVSRAAEHILFRVQIPEGNDRELLAIHELLHHLLLLLLIRCNVGKELRGDTSELIDQLMWPVLLYHALRAGSARNHIFDHIVPRLRADVAPVKVGEATFLHIILLVLTIGVFIVRIIICNSARCLQFEFLKAVRAVDNFLRFAEKFRFVVLCWQRHANKSTLHNLNRNELVLHTWIWNALVVLSVLKRQLLVEEVFLLIDKVVDELLARHIFRADWRCTIFVHHPLICKKRAKHMGLLKVHAAHC